MFPKRKYPLMNSPSFDPQNISSYFKAEWRPLLLVTISGLIYNIGLSLIPWLEGKLAQCLADILGGKQTASAMVLLASLYLAANLMVQGARFIKRFYVRRFANHLNRRMKGILYANLICQNKSSLIKAGAGEWMTKAISDVEDCVEGMRKFTTELFDTGIALAGYIVLLFIFDWRLTLLCLAFTPISYIGAAMMKQPVQQASMAHKKASAALAAATLDRAEHAVTYRVYGCEKAREGLYEEALTCYEKASIKSQIYQTALTPLYLAASSLGILFILYFGVQNVQGSGESSWDIATFTAFLSCFGRLTLKSAKVAKLFNAVQKAEVSWQRIRPLMHAPAHEPPLPARPPMDITLKDVSFAYEDAPLFSGLSFTAHPGDIIGVTGAIASGKSTLGRLFLHEAPYEGSIRLGNRELSDLSAREIAATVGYLGHDPELFQDSVRDNILCASEGDAHPWLALTDFLQEVLAMEQKEDTVIGPSGVRLSGGQAERLALARTLAHPRPLLILDDPFSALDRKTEDKLFAKLQLYGKDKIILLISHRLYHFPAMKEIIFLEKGKMTIAPHETLLAENTAYRTLYEDQTGDTSHEA